MTLLRLYADCFGKTGIALRRSAWTLALPMAYVAVAAGAGSLLAPLGIVGGFAYALVRAALVASFLWVVAELVRGVPVKPREIPGSVQPFFWPLVNVMFVLWVARLLLGPLLARQPAAAAAVGIVVFLVLNALPETLYQASEWSGLATLGRSVSFLQRNWLEWLVPNLIFGAALWLGLPPLARLPGGLLLQAVVAGALVHAAMIFRGFLFDELARSNARSRALKYRYGR